MRKLGLAVAAATALASVAVMGGPAAAAPIGAPGGIRAALDSVNLAEDVQYVFGGKRYCFYDDGWQGPGWYWCGYRWRRGFGWGGGAGWHGWQHGGRYHGRPGFEERRGGATTTIREGARIGGRTKGGPPEGPPGQPGAQPGPGGKGKP